jgi:pyruvate dehydrogenase E1 component beta subunit
MRTVAKTNRVVLLEEGWPYGGITTTVAALIQEEAFDELDAPILRVTQADVPMPYAKAMEKAAKPSAEMVVEKVNRVLYR